MTKTIYVVSKMMRDEESGVIGTGEPVIAFENENDAKQYVKENEDNKKILEDDYDYYVSSCVGLEYEPIKLFSDLKEADND